MGNASQSYRIEVSSDMVTWVSLGTCAQDGNGNVEFTDPNGCESVSPVLPGGRAVSVARSQAGVETNAVPLQEGIPGTLDSGRGQDSTAA